MVGRCTDLSTNVARGSGLQIKGLGMSSEIVVTIVTQAFITSAPVGFTGP